MRDDLTGVQFLFARDVDYFKIQTLWCDQCQVVGIGKKIPRLPGSDGKKLLACEVVYFHSVKEQKKNSELLLNNEFESVGVCPGIFPHIFFKPADTRKFPILNFGFVDGRLSIKCAD